MNTRLHERQDFSMGLQNASSWKLRQRNELDDGRNLRFNEEIGAAVRRNGYVDLTQPFSASGKSPCGFHTAQFTTGTKRFVAVHSENNASTVVKVQEANGTWTTIISDIPLNADVHFTDYRDEVYISGYTIADDVPFTPYNVDKTLNVSQTRNLLFAPKAKYYVVYRGLLYAANVRVDNVNYPDRVYKSSPPTGAITFIRSAQTGTLTSLKVDSTRYLKVGMAIDIYGRESSTKKYDLTITGVNKTDNTISFSSASITVADNDEIFLDGRFGVLSTLWNTDYPTPDKADWTAVQPGTDSSNAITGVREASNRLFVFTLNSANKFDGNTMIAFSKSIGCASHRSIQNLDDDWLVWLTARGRVYARNEAAGQQEYISRGIYNKFLSKLTLTQMKAAAAGITDGEYTIYVGVVDGEPSRAVYDFGSNTWSIDALGHPTLMYANDVVSSVIKPLFLSNDGKIYQDDTGFTDAEKVTRFQMDLGKSNHGTNNEKIFQGHYIYSENAIGLKVIIRIDGGEPIIVGEIARDYGDLMYKIEGNSKKKFTGTIIEVSLKGAVDGPPQVISGVDDYFNMVQEINANAKRQ